MNFGKTYHNFYSVCINAIKGNKDGIMNKNECIKNIEKLSDEKLHKKKPKKLRSLSYLYKPKSIKPKKELMTLQKILTKYKESEAPPQIQEKTDLNNFQSTEINNIEEIRKLKRDLTIKTSKKNVIIFDSNMSKTQNLPRRYAIFKKY